MSDRSDADDSLPSSIGRFEITGTLGFGAMGAVYRAFDPVIGRPLAIKTIRLDVPRQSPQYRTFIERFLQEARISGTLSHPNIVTLFDVGEEDGVPFLAMEFVEGETIGALLEEGTRFKPERVISLVSQVAAGLDYAHSRGVVHRDIKPSNLIVQPGDKVKVTDFGIAKLVDARITQAGTLLGTPSYMSPEQAMGERLDGRSDIFSLGVCAFEMLCGQQPFPGNNVTSILYRLVHVEPVEPSELETMGLLPGKWREVFGKVLSKAPDDRYQTAGTFVQDLELCLGSWFSGPGKEVPGDQEEGAGPTVTLASLPRTEPSAPPEQAARSGGGAETVVLPVEGEPAGPAPSQPDLAETIQVPGGAVTSVAPRPTDAKGYPAPGDSIDGAETLAVPPSVPPDSSATAPPLPGGTSASLPAGRLLAGAAGLFILAAATVGWLLWQRSLSSGPPPVSEVTEPHPVDPPPLAVNGSLEVTSEPEGAQVTLNGEEQGITPLTLEAIPFGAYEVGLEMKGYEGQTRNVSLSAEEPHAEIELALSPVRPTLGRANFSSDPPGAAVAVDGKSVGQTPLEGVRLRPGRHEVVMSLEGHEPWSGTVEVTAGRRASLEAPLKPAPVATPPPTPKPVDTARIYENRAGDVDRVAKKRSGVSPSYPSDRAPRLKSGQRVTVTFSYVVNENGEVEDVRVEESAGSIIDDVVVSAVRKWQYEPARIRGTPVRVRIVRKQTFLGG